jgi:hypothetical protein
MFRFSERADVHAEEYSVMRHTKGDCDVPHERVLCVN